MDVDFRQNKNGYNYGDRGYTGHVQYYRHVQDLLDMARQAFYNNGCDLPVDEALAVDYYEWKDPDPLGHPGHKPHKSLLQQIVDHATIRVPGIPVPVPDPVEVA